MFMFLCFFPWGFYNFFFITLCFIYMRFACEHHKVLFWVSVVFLPLWFLCSLAVRIVGGVPGASGYFVLCIFDSLQFVNWFDLSCLAGVWLSEWTDCGWPQRLSDRFKLHDSDSRRGHQVSALWDWWEGVGLRLPRMFWILFEKYAAKVESGGHSEKHMVKWVWFSLYLWD